MKSKQSNSSNKKQTYAFEEDYFEGYFKGIADFSTKRNKELYNWFLGMFHSIHRYVPLKDGKGKSALEFGCAVGAAAKVLSDWEYKVTATDVSKYAIERAATLYSEIDFFVHDIQKPLAGNKKYDVVYAFDVIEHLSHPERGIKNMYHVVRDNGFVICSTPNDYEHVYGDPSHINVKKPKEWKRIFREVGFSDIIVRQVTFIPYFYRWAWWLNTALPFAVSSPFFISPVFITAKKRK